MSTPRERNNWQKGSAFKTRSFLSRVLRPLGEKLRYLAGRDTIFLLICLLILVILAGRYLPGFLGVWMQGESQLWIVVLFLLCMILHLKIGLTKIQKQVSVSKLPATASDSQETHGSYTVDPHSKQPQPESETEKVDTVRATNSDTGALGIPPIDARSSRDRFPQWMQEVYDQAMHQLRELESEWIKQHRAQARATASSGSAEAQQVADVAADLAAVLQRQGDRSVSVRNLEQMVAQLRALGAPGDDPEIAFRRHVIAPPTPEEWLRAGGKEGDYIEQVADVLRRGKGLFEIEPVSDQSSGAEWRGSAEQLLHTVASRRPSEGEADSYGLHRMHDQLVRLLGWREIAVHRGDSVNRDVHEIESVRGTTELPPNRVLEIISPGYRDTASGDIVRKAKVVLSQQKLG